MPSTYNLGIAKPHLCIHLALRLLSFWQMINQVRDMKNIYRRRCCIFSGSCPHMKGTVLPNLVALLHSPSSRHGKNIVHSTLLRTFLTMRIVFLSPLSDLFLRLSKSISLQCVLLKHLNIFCCLLLISL